MTALGCILSGKVNLSTRKNRVYSKCSSTSIFYNTSTFHEYYTITFDCFKNYAILCFI